MKRDLLLGRSFAVSVASVLLYVLARNFVKSNKKSTRRNADDTSASSSSAASAGGDSYDVFLSFSGEDTRKIFTDHLYNGLINARIRVFRDNNELCKGKKIGTKLLEAIKNSKISIPILSTNYALSNWCLQELVEIIECIKSGHVVLPIFYHVEPTHVRNQEGSFGKTFSRLCRKHLKEDVEKWKVALQEVASLKGWESEKTADGHEGELVKQVVETVLSELKNSFQLVVTEQLIGIDDAVEDILRKLDGDLNGTQIVGIYGMGGIGKTTLAKVVYNQLLDQFQYHSFIADIRESSQHNGIPRLQEQLILDLQMVNRVSNRDEGIRILRSRFKSKKVLILLDDVDNIDQVEALVGKYDWFEMGSRIIITTRSWSVLDKAEVKCKHRLKEMVEDKSLTLFSRHAFRSDSPPCEFKSLSDDVVSTTGGLPLAVTVIGLFLRGQSRDFWQDALKKLRVVLHEEVREKLRISYDALKYDGQQIFLDIACFFIGVDLTHAFYMWDACNFFPKMWIEILSSMSLIKIGDDGKVHMHDQLRDLGRDIVRGEDYNVPMNRSRLWLCKEALEVLEGNKGNKKDRVQALCLDKDSTKDWTNGDCLDLFLLPKREFTTEKFEALLSLRFLTVRHAKMIGDSRSLLPELRWLMWRGCNAFVATNFCLEKLVILDLSGSNISELWEGWSHYKMTKQLKVLNLSYCGSLTVTPNLSTFQNLEMLHLKACVKLKLIDPSIGAAKCLVFLDLQECHILQELPKELSKLEELKELYIGKTDIVEIPPCIGFLKKLEVLSAACCKSLVGLPDSISHLVNLKFLHISNSKKLGNLPSTISKLGSLEKFIVASCQSLGGEIHIDGLILLKILQLSWTSVSGFHGTFDKLTCLEKLELDNCKMLESLSELPTSLTVLEVTGQHRTFPRLSHLINLKKLILKDCPLLESMPELPASLTVLEVTTGQHRTFPQLSHLIDLKKLIVEDCQFLKSMPELPSGLLELSISNCGGLKELPSLSRLKSLSKLYLDLCGELTEIRGLEGLKSLAKLIVAECWKLSNLDGLEHLESLRCLRLLSNNLIWRDDRVPGFEKLKNLEVLSVQDCQSLVKADVSQLTHLKALEFRGCCNLFEIEGLERLENLKTSNFEGCPSIET